MRLFGTWKNKLTHAEALELANDLAAWVAARRLKVNLTVLPSFLSLAEVRRRLPATVEVGAQNVVWDAPNAFTGEVSAFALAAVGCTTVMVGHSERRTFLGEDNEQIARKVVACLSKGLKPLVCVGETYDERVSGSTSKVLAVQIGTLVPILAEAGPASVALAYEPAWAITTNAEKIPADPDLAAVDHAWIRDFLVRELGPTGGSIPIIYGAGVTPNNAAEFVRVPNVDGLLVGGASQSMTTLSRLIEVVEEVL